MAQPTLLVGDIGGTNARFALADANAPGFSNVETLNCTEFDGPDDAIRAYLDHNDTGRPDVICLGAAGPIVDQTVRFTNNPWSLNATELQSVLGASVVRLLNDFEAIAYSIPFLKAGDCLPVGWPDTHQLDNEKDFTIGVIGPGTGLGAVGLLRRGASLYPIVGEAGHEGFAPESQLQIEVLKVLRERFDRLSGERLLSGPGLETLYWALTRLHGEKHVNMTPAEIFSAERSDARAAETVQLFFEILGQVAGNLALTLGAWDGIYIAGGIVPRYPDLIANSRFRTGFEHKGRHRTMMESVPTQLVTYKQPGLLGASHYALELGKAL
jgi:glucokinase